MRKYIYFFVLLFVRQFALRQTENNGHIYISPEILQNIKANIEKEIPAFKKELVAKKNDC